tara:strand:- start:344 stop:562 length:219 start_codon:yes stop_codon:yes gene_type:complete
MKKHKDDDIAQQKMGSVVKKYHFFTNKDYEEMTMRHLPPDHWKESLDKLVLESNEMSEKLETITLGLSSKSN